MHLPEFLETPILSALLRDLSRFSHGRTLRQRQLSAKELLPADSFLYTPANLLSGENDENSIGTLCVPGGCSRPASGAPCFPQSGYGTIGASKGEIIGVLAGGVAVLGVVGYLIYHETHKHPTITGCPTSNGDGLSLTNERDKKAAPDTDSNHASPRGIEADDREHSKHCQAASGMSGTAAEVW